MKSRSFLFCLTLVVLVLGCSQRDYQSEIKAAISQDNIREAKDLYKEWVDAEDNPNIEREYIRFLFENKQYRDFDRAISDYLATYPEDSEIKNLRFDYYAKLATDAEEQGYYGDALHYIVNFLLSPDFRDYRRWEDRQTAVLKKWYEEEAKKKNEDGIRKVLVNMMNLGFENMAKSLNPEVYKELSNVTPESGGE